MAGVVATGMERIEGPNLVLRLIRPEDADYVHVLRMDPAYNTYLSRVTGTAEDQRRWIEDYKSREAAGVEYYYVIKRRDDGRRCGVVRLYDVTGDEFTWGSWILDHNKPLTAALESAFLVYDLAFNQLGLARAIFDVRRDNERTLSFHRRFGAQEVRETAQDIYFVYSREIFQRDRDRHLQMLTRRAR
jgi:RimJ/RimL family protein N-acetyltransferase